MAETAVTAAANPFSFAHEQQRHFQEEAEAATRCVARGCKGKEGRAFPVEGRLLRDGFPAPCVMYLFYYFASFLLKQFQHSIPALTSAANSKDCISDKSARASRFGAIIFYLYLNLYLFIFICFCICLQCRVPPPEELTVRVMQKPAVQFYPHLRYDPDGPVPPRSGGEHGRFGFIEWS